MHESLPKTTDYIEMPSRDLAATTRFPGGRRFHFEAPGCGEFAIWSDK